MRTLSVEVIKEGVFIGNRHFEVGERTTLSGDRLELELRHERVREVSAKGKSTIPLFPGNVWVRFTADKTIGDRTFAKNELVEMDRTVARHLLADQSIVYADAPPKESTAATTGTASRKNSK